MIDAARLRRLPRPDPRWSERADVVVVGNGAAGASAALEAAGRGLRVVVVSKQLRGGSTPWAQGGLAAAVGPGDSLGSHASDTIAAGAGLCDPAAVASLTAGAPGAIETLARLGARFDKGLGLEGGHSHHRIIHAGGDASGAEVHRVLTASLLRAQSAGRLEVWEPCVALDAVLDPAGTVTGILVARVLPGGALEPGLVETHAVVLASGGLGQAYSTSTNPGGSTGDGLALAARAGAALADLEFVQFHPTVLWSPGATGRRPLVSEALRGAGATIVDRRGARVMAAHPRKDLAPRDVVSAAMAQALETAGDPGGHLWLDATALGADRIEGEFPTVVAACRAEGVDPVSEAVPVAPGAHYSCGGVASDLDGTTSVPGLFAVGEVAATGVHGANRLASNSLTEALVAGRRAGRHAAARAAGLSAPARLGHRPRLRRPPPLGPDTGVEPGERTALAAATTAGAGVLRDRAGLEALLARLAGADTSRGGLDLAVLEATNLHTAATLVGVAALARPASAGCHRRRDSTADTALPRRHPEPGRAGVPA